MISLEQTILYTSLPAGITLGSGPLPVSVLVSPRLMGADHLGAFPDWLRWTRLLKERGFTLTFEAGGKKISLPIDPDPLRPDLWEAIFRQETLVRSHEFNDYTERPVLSYDVRMALSVLKSIYQVAGATLQGNPDQEKRGLSTLLEGLQVNWNDDKGMQWRKEYAVYVGQAVSLPGKRTNSSLYNRYPAGMQGPDGLLPTYLLAEPGTTAYQQLNQYTAEQFATFQHVPSAPPIETPDWDNLLDFHQALTALNAYRELQRALGLVFDLELPADFPPPSGPLNPETIAVVKARPGWEWHTMPAPHYPLATAYLHFNLGADHLFLTAPNLTPSNHSGVQAVGLLNLAPSHFGLAQVDVDGGMNKAINLAETVGTAAPAPNSEVYDLNQALPALRSGGFSLFADKRAQSLLGVLKENKDYNDALKASTPQPHPFYAEDLIRGYRLDIWDSYSGQWHSLHLRDGLYQLEDKTFSTSAEEGFVQLAATQAAPDPDRVVPADELYLHEAIARWAGWSLGAPMPGKHLTRHGDPKEAMPRDPSDLKYDPENAPATPFKMTTHYNVLKGSLPRLRFGTRYRVRARVVDLAGNSLAIDDPIADGLAASLALPQDPEGFPYLRFEPVGSPVVVLRDERAVQLPGSALERIVIRTWNKDETLDASPADLLANDRHIAPPRTHVEMAERLGMFDDAGGALITDPGLWEFIRKRDEGQFNQTPTRVVVAGQKQTFALETTPRIPTLPYLPDPMARGAALRDLPGSTSGTRGTAAPGGGPAGAVDFAPLSDPNPRPGSALLVGFGSGDWQKQAPFRLALEEGKAAPHWDPATALLTVQLPKGSMKTVPLSSYMSPEDLKLMGVWQWLGEFINLATIFNAQPQFLYPGVDVDRIAHLLQWAVEGGHWMLTPPRLLTFVHAVQQPLGHPAFTALTVQRTPPTGGTPSKLLHGLRQLKTEPETEPTAETELNPLTGWREPGSTDAYLLGGLYIHGASTEKVDLRASWDDPIDDTEEDGPSEMHFDAMADEIPLQDPNNSSLRAAGVEFRYVAYYDAEHDLLAFVKPGDTLGSAKEGTPPFASLMAPRQRFDDTKHHRVAYTAVSTSRFREYFPQDLVPPLVFTRPSIPTLVDIPASARPAAPSPLYVLPTFGWQRETSTNLKRSVRFGGGLRIYLERPWFSSGAGELLGVALWNSANGALNRDEWKPFITQWGQDPIWQSTGVSQAPSTGNFAGATASEGSLSLEELVPPNAKGQPGTVDVAGFPVEYDAERQLWYCDLTINTSTPVYNPFVRLALVRYQPNALPEAKLSRVVLADFVQLTPERSAVVTADPYHPRTLRVTVSGPAPTGPSSTVRVGRFIVSTGKPTQITVHVQQRDPDFPGELVWQDLPTATAKVHIDYDGFYPAQPQLALWTGTVQFSAAPEPGQYRLLVEEHEYIGANYVSRVEARGSRTIRRVRPGRLIYAETIDIDSALVGAPGSPASGEGIEV